MNSYPSDDEIKELWKKYHLFEPLIKHSIAVAKVAFFLAEKLHEKGVDVDINVARSAALLHDLTRASNFTTLEQPESTEDDRECWKNMKKELGDTDHADSAADILLEKYPEVAKAVRCHGIRNFAGGTEGWSWEMKIVKYADERALFDRIVSIEERLENTAKRHAGYFEKLKKDDGKDYFKITKSVSENLENEIFGIIGINPEEVNKLNDKHFDI